MIMAKLGCLTLLLLVASYASFPKILAADIPLDSCWGACLFLQEDNCDNSSCGCATIIPFIVGLCYPPPLLKEDGARCHSHTDCIRNEGGKYCIRFVGSPLGGFCSTAIRS